MCHHTGHVGQRKLLCCDRLALQEVWEYREPCQALTQKLIGCQFHIGEFRQFFILNGKNPWRNVRKVYSVIYQIVVA